MQATPLGINVYCISATNDYSRVGVVLLRHGTQKNILGTMAHSYGATALVSIVWIVLGYSLAFGSSDFNQFVGGFDNALLANIGLGDLTGTIPTYYLSLFK